MDFVQSVLLPHLFLHGQQKAEGRVAYLTLFKHSIKHHDRLWIYLPIILAIINL